MLTNGSMRRVTDLAKDKQALAVTQSLTGQYKEVAIAFTADQLNSNNGMDALLGAMDTNI